MSLLFGWLFVLAQVSPQSWDAFAKLLISVGVALLTISGGLFWFAWTVANKARREWRTLADEWSESADFTKAVNEARQPLTQRLILETNNEIDKRIAEHNANLEAHRPAIKHGTNNTEAVVTAMLERQGRELQRQVDENRQRLDALEVRFNRRGWPSSDN